MHDPKSARDPKSAPGIDATAGRPPPELARLRREILKCDRELVTVIARRRDLVQRVGKLKRRLGLPVTDPAREAAVARHAAEAARAEGIDDEMVRELVWKVMASARDEQSKPSSPPNADGSNADDLPPP